jgi:predicted nucleic acid-binding protein
MNIVDSSGWLAYFAEYHFSMADSIILATAKAYNAILWTQDADFKNMPGVKYFLKK